MPEPIQQRPELLCGLDLYLGAFNELASCRPLGPNGVDGPIPWTAIRDWAIEHDLRGEQRGDLFHHVRVLDNAYLRRQRTAVERAHKRAQTSAKPRKRGRRAT